MSYNSFEHDGLVEAYDAQSELFIPKLSSILSLFEGNPFVLFGDNYESRMSCFRKPIGLPGQSEGLERIVRRARLDTVVVLGGLDACATNRIVESFCVTMNSETCAISALSALRITDGTPEPAAVACRTTEEVFSKLATLTFLNCKMT